MPLQKQLSLIFPLLLTSFSGYSTPEQAYHHLYISKNPPPARKIARPPGRRVPGGTRNPKFCPNTPLQVTALIAKNGQGNTISEHPIFWFYFPYTSNQIISAEFSLNDGKDQNNIYRIAFKIPPKSGIISIPSPPEPKYALKPNQDYHWFLEIKCQSNQSSESNNPNSQFKPDISLNGWIQTVMPNPASQTITVDLWYDYLTELAKRRLDSPSNSLLADDWTKLLKSVELESLAQEPLLGLVEYIQIKE